MTFQTLPVYEQVAAAIKSGKPVINLNIIGYTEAQIIILDGLPHKVHPVKWTSNEIRIVTNDKKWGVGKNTREQHEQYPKQNIHYEWRFCIAPI